MRASRLGQYSIYCRRGCGDLILFGLASEGFSGENCKFPEERFSKCLSFFDGQFQVLLDFGLKVTKFFRRRDFGEPLEK